MMSQDNYRRKQARREQMVWPSLSIKQVLPSAALAAAIITWSVAPDSGKQAVLDAVKSVPQHVVGGVQAASSGIQNAGMSALEATTRYMQNEARPGIERKIADYESRTVGFANLAPIPNGGTQRMLEAVGYPINDGTFLALSQYFRQLNPELLDPGSPVRDTDVFRVPVLEDMLLPEAPDDAPYAQVYNARDEQIGFVELGGLYSGPPPWSEQR